MAADAGFRRWARLHDPGDHVGALAAFYVDAKVKQPGTRCVYCGHLCDGETCEHCSDLPGCEPTGGW